MTSPAIASATAVLLTGAAVLLVYDLGHFSTHMVLHIASMNIIAPSVAALIVTRRHIGSTRPFWLWTATFLQIVLLWTWHSPAVYDLLLRSPGAGLTFHATLLLAALFFWLSLLTTSAASRWQTIPALLLTGKLTCLLAALLIFAPRTLYGFASHLGDAPEHFSLFHALEDQQLAGLLMITACPLSYLVAAVIITVQLLTRAETSAAPMPDGRLLIGR
ncbi:cytochrome c oxidase assembly protein [Bradyrhizobium sp. sBnM-33]|uniref:cytochrome c oxidase assembly protein n=1 Tax=Bradyrhizobium sp. sBnM-33 TaxID=2831780 RepID=UPI001BCB90B3|nr:cytochrome c oxidase assembly protein [Bradyrhizobium sp. sBnM-33]WOH48516.1 cytochrome c oxidase assembly protein [Bradyrhizobium sp. sBnM-33]